MGRRYEEACEPVVGGSEIGEKWHIEQRLEDEAWRGQGSIWPVESY